MNITDFLKYVYAYYLLSTSGEARWRGKPNSDVLRFLETLIEKAERLPVFHPNKSRFSGDSKALKLALDEVLPLLTSLDSAQRANAITAFSPMKDFYSATTQFVIRTAFRDWKNAPITLDAEWLPPEHLRLLKRQGIKGDIHYKGAVVAVHPRGYLTFCISDAEWAIDGLTSDAGHRVERNEQLLFGPQERIACIDEVLAGLHAEGVPKFWFGTDVTALIDADSRIERSHNLLVAPSSTGFILRAPESRRRFRETVTILTNHTGIHSPSLAGFPEDPTPLMRFWKDMASDWAVRELAAPMKRLDQYATTTINDEVIQHFIDAYTLEDLPALASVSAMQINNRHDMDIFWKSRNTPDHIRETWDLYSRTFTSSRLLEPFSEIEFKITDTPEARDTNLKPEQFGLAYAVWSYAKGFVNANQYPEGIHYRVAWQRRKSIEARFMKPDAELVGRRTLPGKAPLPAILFPWGVILDHLFDLVNAGRGNNWLYSLIRKLRTYTVVELPKLRINLANAMKNGAQKGQTKRHVPTRAAYELVAFFAIEGLKHLQVESSLSLYAGELRDVFRRPYWVTDENDLRLEIPRDLPIVLSHQPRSRSPWLRSDDLNTPWPNLIKESVVRSGPQIAQFLKATALQTALDQIDI